MAEESSGRGPVRTVHLDGRQIRTLAHPLRLRLLGALRMDGPATATTLADKLRTNTGATSYHLRQLADVGLVVEDPDRASGRQRWWRAAHDITHFEPTDFDGDPDARAAVEWLESDWIRWMAEQAERWMAAARNADRAWREAAAIGDMMLRLDPTRLRALNDELHEVVMRYRDEPVPDPANARDVFVFLSAFPRVEER
ncbi:winged helix-turn-helix domain-containing protein [Micromonospora sp. NPDC049799]|uniref:ArsR/SmtB family transcription factor n=1 Tax=Micromonospora sp. NPDC049799 TaxID=3154741 RepID=UPI0033CC4E5D